MIPAAIVTFHPDPDWPRRLECIAREHPRVIVADNSVEPAARAWVAEIVARHAHVTLLPIADNPGIGVALNEAFAVLHAEGHTRAVAYDQDSIPEPGFINALANTANAFSQAAVIGANWRDPRRPNGDTLFLRSGFPLGLGFRRVPASTDLTGLLCVITSGSLFDLRIWHTLGGFDADLFLDLVDTDYCLRAKRAGHGIVASRDARLVHHRGDKQAIRRLGSDFYPAHTPLFRLRCLSRNRLLLFRRHRLRPLAWVCYELAYTTKLVADALFLEENPGRRLAAMIQGTWEGLLGRSGPVRPSGKLPSQHAQ